MRLDHCSFGLYCLLSACSTTATAQSSAAAPSNHHVLQQLSPATTAQGETGQSNQIANALELQLLSQLGWQDVYDPSGYSIDGTLPSNCSLSTWGSLGGLHSLVNLTLTGNLPDLPDSWADDDAFPALQSIVFATANLTGNLPAIWGQGPAFTALKVLNLSATQLSGSPPADHCKADLHELAQLINTSRMLTCTHDWACTRVHASCTSWPKGTNLTRMHDNDKQSAALDPVQLLNMLQLPVRCISPI